MALFPWPSVTPNYLKPSHFRHKSSLRKRLNRSSSFLAERLLSAYPTLCWKGIRGYLQRKGTSLYIDLSPKVWKFPNCMHVDRLRWCQLRWTVNVINYINYYFEGTKKLSRGNEVLIRENEILFRSHQIVIRGDEIEKKNNDVLFRAP